MTRQQLTRQALHSHAAQSRGTVAWHSHVSSSSAAVSSSPFVWFASGLNAPQIEISTLPEFDAPLAHLLTRNLCQSHPRSAHPLYLVRRSSSLQGERAAATHPGTDCAAALIPSLLHSLYQMPRHFHTPTLRILLLPAINRYK